MPRIELRATLPSWDYSDVFLETFRAFDSPSVTDVSLRLAARSTRLDRYRRINRDTCLEAELVRCFPSVVRLTVHVGLELDELFRAFAPRSSEGGGRPCVRPQLWSTSPSSTGPSHP